MAATKRDGISRIERAAMAKRLRDQGFYYKEIAQKLGISRSYAISLIQDPDGSKDAARKERYRGICPDCGGLTTYGKTVTRCIACARAHQKENRKWTRERIIAEIKRWNLIYGRPPKAQEWLTLPPSGGNREWPHVSAIQDEFGSWSNALKEAGFEPRLGYERTEEWKEKVTKWPREKILQALRDWNEEHGRPPTSSEWRLAGEMNPSYTIVLKRFGSWNKGLRAAGLPILNPGQRLSAYRPMPDRAYGSIPFEERAGRSLMDVVAELKGDSDGREA